MAISKCDTGPSQIRYLNERCAEEAMDDVMTNKQRLALLYGILLGDGCLSKVGNKHYFISIAGNSVENKLFFDYVGKLLERLSGRVYKIKLGRGNSMQFNFTNKRMFHLLKSFGFPVGKKGTRLEIPIIFGQSALKCIARGYFATDGSLVLTNNNGLLYPRIEFASISKKLLFQILRYLKTVGMSGRVYVSKKYNDDPTRCTLYRIQCNGKTNLETFRNKLGFVNPKHEAKYQGFKKMAVARFEPATTA